MDFENQRSALVKKLIHYRVGGMKDASVIRAFKKVPRHRFIETSFQAHAYEDRAIPIACDQTISQPFIVCWMSESLALNKDHRVLEIGTGSGYQTAILGEIVKEVYTIEYYPDLAQQAHELLNELGDENIHFRTGDGYEGWAESAPFDSILVACRVDEVPPSLIDQLTEGGRIVIPVGLEHRQILHTFIKCDAQLHSLNEIEVRFVPLLRNC
jgi:protein-L-isoaspartate(D-aspartate) O-methyltransferase